MLAAQPTTVAGLVQANHSANAALYEAMTGVDGALGMGTAAAAVLVHADGIAVTNVGDSATFEFVEGRLVQLSVDDVPAGAGALPGLRSSGVTQTLGGTERPSKIKPHLYEDDLDTSRRFMICSDGLTTYVRDRRSPKRSRRSTEPRQSSRCSIWRLRPAVSTI